MQKAKRKNNKGITLIALIITIIVMIILVAVTVNVAINGGLFGTASTASQRTERDGLYDQIVGAMKLTADGKIDKTGTYNAVEEILEGQGRTVEPLQEDGTFEVIGTRGTYTYKITEEKIIKGEIIGEGSGVGLESGTENGDDSGGTDSGSEGNGGEEVDPTDIPEELSKYLLGADGKGKNIEELKGDYGFVQDPEDTNSTIHEKIKLAYLDFNEETDEEIWHIRYNREIYKFKVEYIEDSNGKNEQVIVVEGSLEKVSTPKENLGKYVEYAGNTWIVLREDSTGVELITANTTENEVTLGGSDFDAAKDSYNTAVATLVEECKKATGLEIGGNVRGIRCVGGPTKDETTGTIDFSKIVSNADFPFAEYTGKNIKIGDDNYLKDYNQMKKIGILCADNESDYWLASRSVDIEKDEIDFNVRCCLGAGFIDGAYVFYMYYSGAVKPCNSSYTLRPVVTLKAGILNGATESGLIDDPIILD